MRHILTTIFFLNILFAATAQNLHLNFFAGFSNYQGDLQDKRFTLQQSHPAAGLGILYELTKNLYARANVSFGKISGDDKKVAKNAVRNLSFASPVTDIHAGLEYHMLNIYEHQLVPYVFAGISYFSFNPSAKDSLDRTIFLQSLSTEGQGFYQGRKKYKLGQLAIPFGGGLKFALNDNMRLAFEIGMRKTNTDYLDDVSTTYIDQSILLANRGQQAVNLAFRGDELNTALTYPAGGTQRGSAKSKDWYYFSGITLSIRLNGNRDGAGRANKTGCPTNIY
jgi:hypothetical protein